MNPKKKLLIEVLIALLLFLCVSFISFTAGAIVYRLGLYRRIPGVHYVIKFAKKTFFAETPQKVESHFYYSSSDRRTSELSKIEDVEYPFTFIVYGDSREPAGFEKDMLIEKIIEEKPLFVIHLGDMVIHGDEHNWKIFDTFDGTIITHDIPVYPVLGNHEYSVKTGSGHVTVSERLSHYFKRFPFLRERRWYSFTYGNSMFLMLDSNTNCSPGSSQYEWFMKKLKEETRTNFLFVAHHHPPYTKSVYKTVRESEKSLAAILESYDEKDLIKATIDFAGDAHNYERYENNGINYVVSGGGGAPQYPVKRDKEDFYQEPGDVFHYCRITVEEEEVFFEMVRLLPDSGNWVVRDQFTVSR